MTGENSPEPYSGGEEDEFCSARNLYLFEEHTYWFWSRPEHAKK